MSSEAGHIQISEFNKEVIPSINYMMEDLFCQYGVSLPWFMCDFDFPDFSQRPDWVSGYNFNLDWGEWGYWLPWFNELLGLLWDEAHLPRLTLPDLSPGSWAFFNDYTEILYDNMQRHYVYGQTGTFIKDEVIEGGTSGITGWYKWIDGDGYIHIANKQDASGETVADFEDEKIVGADSGAYAWTYEDYTWTETYNETALDLNLLRRIGDGSGCVNAWSDYDADPTWVTDPAFNDWSGSPQTGIYTGCTYDGVNYHGVGRKKYVEFDTNGATSGGNSLTFRFTVSEFVDFGGTPILYLYSQDFGDTLESGDWTGGTKVGELVIDSTGVKNIPIATDIINLTGNTRFRLSLKDVEENNHIDAERVTFSYIRLVWEKE